MFVTAIYLFLIYSFMILSRHLDPTQEVIKYNDLLIFILSASLVLTFIVGINITEYHVLVPLTMLALAELVITILDTKYLRERDQEMVFYINGLYAHVYLYTLMIPIGTLVAVIYILCTR